MYADDGEDDDDSIKSHVHVLHLFQAWFGMTGRWQFCAFVSSPFVFNKVFLLHTTPPLVLAKIVWEYEKEDTQKKWRREQKKWKMNKDAIIFMDEYDDDDGDGM